VEKYGAIRWHGTLPSFALSSLWASGENSVVPASAPNVGGQGRFHNARPAACCLFQLSEPRDTYLLFTSPYHPRTACSPCNQPTACQAILRAINILLCLRALADQLESRDSFPTTPRITLFKNRPILRLRGLIRIRGPCIGQLNSILSTVILVPSSKRGGANDDLVALSRLVADRPSIFVRRTEANLASGSGWRWASGRPSS